MFLDVHIELTKAHPYIRTGRDGHVSATTGRETLQTEGWRGRLVNTFLQYHFDSVSGTYRGTNTAPFAISIINLNLIPIAIDCYG
jgi:hypothetical protein